MTVYGAYIIETELFEYDPGEEKSFHHLFCPLGYPCSLLPSPMIAMTLKVSFFLSLPSIMPRAADIEVELCPVPKASCSLSFLLGKPEMPPYCLSVEKLLYLPVRSLWG